MRAAQIAAVGGIGLLMTLVSATPPAIGATTQDDFALKTTHDLVDLCSAAPGDPLHDQAHELCLGYIAGAAHLHRYLVATKRLAGGPLACPDPGLTRDFFAKEFVTWANAHTQYMGDPPIETVARAASEKYPCPKEGSSKRKSRK
jgi:hypothetical protein